MFSWPKKPKNEFEPLFGFGVFQFELRKMGLNAKIFWANFVTWPKFFLVLNYIRFYVYAENCMQKMHLSYYVFSHKIHF